MKLRLNLHRLFRRPAVTGPYRIYVSATPTGVRLDVEHYLIAMIQTIADNADLMDLLVEIEDDRRTAKAHRHDGWEPDELLVERLTAALGYELPVHGRELTALADRLRAADWAVNSTAIPTQLRESEAAA
ncbi:hypothetical protein AB0N17_03380 [Streptomyces sp. NPDC051133]|uniref:hypothetical protein n=1 Tax=Streptomyces sp. NPDC051133 TaxID=3155521 RepID=UPI00341F2338